MITFAPVQGKFNFGSMSMDPPPMVECSRCAAIILAGKEATHANYHGANDD